MDAKSNIGTVHVTSLSSLIFECDGTMIQACNRQLSIWLSWGQNRPPDIEIDFDVIRKMIEIAEKQLK
jgi:hypothetical protein